MMTEKLIRKGKKAWLKSGASKTVRLADDAT